MSNWDTSVARFDGPRGRLKGLVKDGEQHWVGGIVNYSPGPADYSDKDVSGEYEL